MSFQVRRVILVQACVRRFLYRRKYLRMKREMTFSVLTIQKYIRGWMVRKNTQELRKKQKRVPVVSDGHENRKINDVKSSKEVINRGQCLKRSNEKGKLQNKGGYTVAMKCV